VSDVRCCLLPLLLCVGCSLEAPPLPLLLLLGPAALLPLLLSPDLPVSLALLLLLC
jgi:hypothetical protein